LCLGGVGGGGRPGEDEDTGVDISCALE
jgi:hypothetical protein